MSWILLTNDDGIDSPALAPFAVALERLGAVRVVVPDRERSWVGKAITRFDPIRVEEVDLNGGKAWTCTGYPADSVQIGIHGLFEEMPSLVVSGINVGYNHGAAFLMSSGTVGAAIEAWVSGVPAIAISTGTNGPWQPWKQYVHTTEAGPGWALLSDEAVDLIGDILDSGLDEHADVVTVNMPYETNAETERRVTSVARVGYDRLFARAGDVVFTHDFGGGLVEFDAIDGSDVAAAAEGTVSITPLLMPAASNIPDAVRARLER